ncbi:peptide chain release factor 3 [Buchnera aphidicola]|uniref:peptide chain release factor 3 n=1 Tax=Buchnera aphidicola TaxID=9 RepID=UPI003F5400A5
MSFKREKFALMKKIILDQKDISKIKRRRTFAIISHPDSGKTTITEKFLLLGKVIHQTGIIKPKRFKKYTKSDWMDIERQRGISINTSVMSFSYLGYHINLLDTPGHEDFSEDTYRVLTAVDCCLIIIDGSKSVESRTEKLMKVARIKKIPIITFINKIDRNTYNYIKILDDIERKLKIFCVPINWPIGCGKLFKGIYDIYTNKISLFTQNSLIKVIKKNIFLNHNDFFLRKYLEKNEILQLLEDLELIQSCYNSFNKRKFLQGKETPLFFGSALNNFGIKNILNKIVLWAPYPKIRNSLTRKVFSIEKYFSGFVFKIQANMNPKHHDRIAFIRIVSGKYTEGMKFYHVRTKKIKIIKNAVNFIAGERCLIKKAYPGDIIGIHHMGDIKIGDTFTEGELINFIEVPKFAPEYFKIIYLKDSFQQKKLLRGLKQLSEEGVISFFQTFIDRSLILGVIGKLQFDIVLERLKIEYHVVAKYRKTDISIIRWISSTNKKAFEIFKKENDLFLAYDNDNEIIFFTTNIFKLNLIKSQYKDIYFSEMKRF